MATIPTACATALAALARSSGQTVQYRTTHAGSFATLTGAFLQQGPPVIVGYDDKRNAILAPQSARLKVPFGGVHLTPGAGNAEVKDQTGTVWSVVGVDHAIGQSIYELQRAIVQSEGPARGSVP